MPLLGLLLSRVINFLAFKPLMFLVLFLLQLFPLLVLLLVHLFLFLLVFLFRLWISRVRGSSIRSVHLWQILRVNVVGPVGVVVWTIRTIFRPASVRGAIVRTTIRWRIVLASFSRWHHYAAAKCSRSLRRSNRGLPMIFRGSQFAIRTRRLYVLGLRSHRRHVPLASGGLLFAVRSRGDAAVSTVITHAGHVDVVVH